MKKPLMKDKRDALIFDAFLKHTNYNVWSVENKALFESYYPSDFEKGGIKSWLIFISEQLKLNIDWQQVMDEVDNPKKGRRILSPHIDLAMTEFTDFTAMASKFIAIQPLMYDRAGLWWLWSDLETRWMIIDEVDLLNTLDDHVHSPASIKTFMKIQILEALKRAGRRAIPKLPPKHWVQFKNKVVDVKTNEEYPVSPDYFFTNPIPWNIGESEETPVIDKLFDQWVGPQFKQTLYEILAYCLIPDYPIQRIFCFVGSGMNGKTTFLKINDKFIGRNNITSASLDLLISSRFESSKLYKKLVCFIGETNFEGMRKTEVLKNLSDGGITSFEFKRKDHITENNTAKILVATNSLPETADKTLGFYRRWLIIKFVNRFSEKIDVMATIPDVEFQNLARKSIRILHTLYETRVFTNEGTVEERQKTYENTSNPLQRFINEKVVHDTNETIFKYEFAERFEVYCKEHGYRVMSKQEVGYKLSPIFESNTKSFYINNEHKTYKVWQGVRWRNENDGKNEGNGGNGGEFTDITNITVTYLNPLYKGLSKEGGNVGNVGNMSLDNNKKLTKIEEVIIDDSTTQKQAPNRDIVHLKCKYCDAPESICFSKTGAPICLYCIQNENLKKHWPAERESILKSSDCTGN